MASALEQACRERGVRLSLQRRIILEVLQTAEDHPCAADLHQRIAGHGISVATVYRALNSLAEAGLLVRRDFGDGKARYERTQAQRHDHLIDLRSGKIIELSDCRLAPLLQAVADRLGYRLVGYRMDLFGEPVSPGVYP
jgi:Fur family ferric uptake transcriptional regulator